MSLMNVFNGASPRDLAKKSVMILLSSTILFGGMGNAFAQDYNVGPIMPQTRSEQAFGQPTGGETWAQRIERACRGNQDCVNDIKVQVGPEIANIQYSAMKQNGDALSCVEKGVNKGNKAHRQYERQQRQRDRNGGGSDLGNVLGAISKGMGAMGGFNACVSQTAVKQQAAIARQEQKIRTDINKIASQYIKAEARETRQELQAEGNIARSVAQQELAKLQVCQKQELKELNGKGTVTSACRTILDNAAKPRM